MNELLLLFITIATMFFTVLSSLINQSVLSVYCFALLCLSSNCFIGILFSDRPTKQLEDKSRKQSNRTIRATGLPILGF